MEECIYTYIKANNIEKTNKMLMDYKSTMTPKDINQFEDSINNFIGYLQTLGMASRFSRVSDCLCKL